MKQLELFEEIKKPIIRWHTNWRKVPWTNKNFVWESLQTEFLRYYYKWKIKR